MTGSGKSDILFQWVEPEYESDYGLKDIKFSLKSISIFLSFYGLLPLGMVWFFIINLMFPTFLEPSLSNKRLFFNCVIFALPIAIYMVIHFVSVVPYLLKKLDYKTETKFQITSTTLKCYLLRILGVESLKLDKMKTFGFSYVKEVEQVMELYFTSQEEEEIRIGGIGQAEAEQLTVILQSQAKLQYIERDTIAEAGG